MRVFRVLAVLTFGAAVGAQAQVANTQPAEKLLVLPLFATTPRDSAASIATMDVARARLVQLARYKALVIPKAKICEALTQSGFPCDGLMSAVQAGQLARALSINSYTTGEMHADSVLVARIRVISGASGFASSFTLSDATPGALGEAIAQRLLTTIRAAEYARNCNDQRSRNALDRAISEARKAFAIQPDLAAANLCLVSVSEVRHAPPDSIIAAARRALKGDPGNSEAWNRIAATSMVKADTVGAFDAYDSLLSYNPTDLNLRKGLAQLLLQHKDYDRAQRLLKGGLDMDPDDQQLHDMRKVACIEGGLYACTLAILKEDVAADSTKLADTTMLKLALANAQAAADTQAILWWAQAAATHFPTSPTFIKQLAGAFQMVGQADSAVAYYKKALVLNPGDVATSLLIGKAIVDDAVWDTATARRLLDAKDTVGLRHLREPFAARLDSARAFFAPGLASSDSSIQLFTINVTYTGGSKLAQAGALDLAYAWLDPVFQRLENDTASGHQPLRSSIAYLFGLASTYTMPPLLQQLGASKKCDLAPALNDRIQRAHLALNLGARVAPLAVRQPLATLARFEDFMQQVKRSFKCRNF